MHSTDTVNRARSVQGHMSAVVRMIEEDAYCMDILRQTQAVQKALDKLNAKILEHHLNSCVTTAIRSNKPKEREKVLKELLEAFEMASEV